MPGLGYILSWRERRRFCAVWGGTFCYCLSLLLVGGAGRIEANSPESSVIPVEYQLKAVFLYNLMKYVDWPTNESNQPPTLTIGILGKDPFGRHLDEVVRLAKPINGRRVRVLRFREKADPEPCDLLYICQSEKGRAEDILASQRQRPVLTVSELEGFCECGRMVQLRMEHQSARLSINLGEAERIGIRISSKLLRQAVVIGTNPKLDVK